MHTAKYRMAIAIAFLSIAGILYSPMCNLSCALSSCTGATSASAGPGEQSNHCHRTADSQEQSSAPLQSPLSPQPGDNSGTCPSHVEPIAVLPPTVNTTVGMNQILHSVSIEPVTIAAFYFDIRCAIRAEGKPFRSPPSLAISSILRI